MSQSTPPRPRTLARRIALWISNAFLILLVLLVAAHAIRSWRASNVLSRAIAEIESRGEPMTVTALQPELPPDEQNAYVELKEVMRIVSTKTDAAKAFDDLIGEARHPLSPVERDVFAAHVAERKSALPLIDRAAAKPQCVMDITLSSPLLMTDVTELHPIRSVARWLRAESLVASGVGDHATAVTRLMQIEVPARAAASHPSITQHLVATSCRAIQAEAMLTLAPELSIGDSPGSVRTDQIERAIASSLDATKIDAEQRRAYLGERVSAAELIRDFGTDPGVQAGVATERASGVARYVWGPMLDANALASIEASTALLPLLSSPDLPTFESAAKAWEAVHAPTKRAPTRVLSIMMVQGQVLMAEAKYRLLTDRHLAATALAVRWYRVDHGGAWPGSLEALVPKYLPEVPKDPMSAGGTIRYRAGDRPILWSVGTNGVDDSGDDTRQRQDDHDWRRPDRVVYLTVQPRAADEQ